MPMEYASSLRFTLNNLENAIFLFMHTIDLLVKSVKFWVSISIETDIVFR